MQSTDSLIVHFFFFSSLALNLLVSLTVKTRQINAPKWPAKISCRENLPDSPTRIIRRIYLPEKPAISTRGFLARDPPFPAQNSQARPGPPTLPPPPTAPPTERGEGAGSRPGPPTHIEQVLFISFPISWMATYSSITQHIHILHGADQVKYKYIAVGEGIILSYHNLFTKTIIHIIQRDTTFFLEYKFLIITTIEFLLFAPNFSDLFLHSTRTEGFFSP